MGAGMQAVIPLRLGVGVWYWNSNIHVHRQAVQLPVQSIGS